MSRVLNRRTIRIMEENVIKKQFGFRRGKSMREAIGFIKTIGERYREREEEK